MKIKDIRATLRSFRLEEDSFPIIMENVALLLRTMSINIYTNQSVSWFYYVITTIAGICYGYFYLFSMLWMVLVRYSIKDNFIALTVAVSLTFSNVTCITKFLFMMLHVRHIRKTVTKFLAFDAKIVPGTRFEIKLRKNLRIVKKRVITIWIFLAINGVVYLLIPLMRPGRHFAEELYILYGLEPMLESPNYEIVHILNFISILFCVYVMVNIAILVMVIVGYNEAQLYALSEELKFLWDDSQKFYKEMKHQIRNRIRAVYMKKKIVNNYIRIRLNTMAQYHVTNIYFFRDLNNEFSEILAIEYSILSLAIIAELLGGLENTYLEVPYTIIQIFMDCLSGQRLIDACNEFENALYCCEWENFNASNQRTILLMLVISQKTLMLSAGGMANLNFSCLMAILKTSYSVYTALKSHVQRQ